MLSRVLEPEVMDSPGEALAYDAMDHSEVNRRFVDDLLAVCSELEGDETAHGASNNDSAEIDEAAERSPLDVLDIGTGTALIPIELCRRVAIPRVTAIDLATSMLHLARGNIEVANLRDRIRVDRIDAKQLPYADGQFALVISNSIVHHIPDPAPVLGEALRVLAPGGLLFVRDLLRPEDDATVDHLVATYAAGADERQRRLFDDSLRAALSLDEIRKLAEGIGLDPECVLATSDRHWTLAARKQQ
ncbi:MAG TPA: class I SAM-dependent methyltransferase [Pirellulales bacterium]|jgi:SAM-dependent methyltransferase